MDKRTKSREFILTDTECIVVKNRKLNSDGYYRVRHSGKHHMHHRYIWEKRNGPIPKGYEINHICRNRACSNLDHLELLGISEHRTLTNNQRDFKIGEWAKEGNRKYLTND